LAVYSALRRGWFFGSQEFREMVLKLATKRLAGRAHRKADGYQGAELGDHGKRRAEQILEAGLAHFAVSLAELRSAAKGDWRKGVLAALMQKETSVRLDWISEAMRMGQRSSCCRTIRLTREMIPRRNEWIEATEKIREMSRRRGCSEQTSPARAGLRSTDTSTARCRVLNITLSRSEA
jgi:hypothetical protein